MGDEPTERPLQPEAAPVDAPGTIEPAEAARVARWLRRHLGASYVALSVAAIATALVRADYGGPLWPVVGLSLIAGVLSALATSAMVGLRVTDTNARTSALGGAALLAATVVAYVQLVVAGSTDLELTPLPLHALGLLLFGALLSLAAFAAAVGRLTADRRPSRAAKVAGLGLVLAALVVGAELTGLFDPNPLVLLVPGVLHLGAMHATHAALRDYSAASAPAGQS